MRKRVAFAGFVATVAGLSPVLISGCTSKNDTASPASIHPVTSSTPQLEAVRPVSLPDLSRLTESVRAQVHERYSSLKLKMENPGTPSLELSNAYGEMGKLLMAARQLNAAEPYYLNAQALVPSDMRWPYYLGHLYRDKSELAKSAESFEQTLRLQPDHVPTRVWLADVYIAQGRPEAAAPLLTKALSLNPRSTSAHFTLGRAALATNDYSRAVKHLEEALSLDQRATAAHYPLALAYRGLGDRAQAEAHLAQHRDVVEIAPADPLMQELDDVLQSALNYEVLGTRAISNGEWEKAAGYFRKGIELEPANPSLRHKLGTVFFETGDARGAVQQFEEAIRVSPEYAKAHYSLGVVMISSGRYKEATDRFSAAVRYEPSYVEARVQLAGNLRRTGRTQESITQYRKIIEIDPRVAEATFGYAMALVSLGRYQEARDRLAEGMKVYSHQPGFAHALARLLAAAPDDRVRDGRRAMALMESLSDEQKTMDLGETVAMMFAELGRYDEAAASQREAIAAAKRTAQDELARRMSENLKLYEARRPCRTPWRPGELP
jgi:tetratricopeptide (TPR) repeat protein